MVMFNYSFSGGMSGGITTMLSLNHTMMTLFLFLLVIALIGASIFCFIIAYQVMKEETTFRKEKSEIKSNKSINGPSHRRPCSCFKIYN